MGSAFSCVCGGENMSGEILGLLVAVGTAILKEIAKDDI